MKYRTLLASLVVVLSLFVAGADQALAQEDPGVASILETLQIPFLDDWLSSAHADFEAEAFRHWDEEDPAEVPTSCAKCHTDAGYRDYVGADGSEVNVVDSPAPVGSVIACATCHNQATIKKTSVIMPSGLELTGLGDEARCMECHQGRQSTMSVNRALEEAGVEDVDAVNEELGFPNIHYYAAAATKYGTLAKGGYEYEGSSYDANFAHVAEFDTCIECHNQHTLEVRIDGCVECHVDVESVEDLRDVRMAGSAVDYDGDGDLEEGIYYELQGLREQLYATIQTYAGEVAGMPIVYDESSHPYFFADTNEDGARDADEGEFEAWTARLLKAAYNYQTATKDPGAFAHGGKYIIELMHDSIADLNVALTVPTDLAAAHRIDAGHFAGSEEAFRHWDEDPAVPGTCAKCHTAGGLPQLIAEGVTISSAPSNGFQCRTCHNELPEFSLRTMESVTFPSGATVSLDEKSNLCMTCHQGRESTVSVNTLIGDLEPDETGDNLRFLNVHYFAAGATRFGTEAKGAYEYDGKEYFGFFDHANANACSDCHMTHGLQVKWQDCVECHEEVEAPEDIRNIRYYFDDYDGDGNEEEGIAFEIETLHGMLYEAMQAYAADELGTGILYDAQSYPYFFVDGNGNGEADEGEVSGDTRFNDWTPRLLRAAYNYQYVEKDPGGFAHNGAYLVQVLYDSLEDLGADVSDMLRP
jgi:hypothetical protein